MSSSDRRMSRRRWLREMSVLGIGAIVGMQTACSAPSPSTSQPATGGQSGGPAAGSQGAAPAAGGAQPTSAPPKPTEKPAAPAAGAQQAAPAKSEAVTLMVLVPEHWKVVEGIRANSAETVPPRRLWFYERVKQWEQAQPSIKLDWQTAAWEQIATNFITASEAGNPPDVLAFDSGYLNSVAQGGYLAPLDGFKYDEWDDFNPYVQNDILTIDGKKYGISNYLATIGLMYNRDLLKQAGFNEPPVTWEDVVRQGKALTKDTRGTGKPDRWGFGALMMGQLNQTPPAHLSTMVWSQGGEIVDAERKAIIDSAEMRRAVQQIVDLINKDQVMSKDVISLKANDEIELLANGIWASGMLITSYYPPIVEKLGKENVGFSYNPKFAGGQDFGYVEVFGWHMSKKTGENRPRAEAAFEFMKWLGANDTLYLAAKHQFGQPSRKSAAQNPIYTADPVLKFMAEYTATKGRPLPHMVEKEFWMEALMEGVHAAILEQKSVDQALKDAQAKYNARARRA